MFLGVCGTFFAVFRSYGVFLAKFTDFSSKNRGISGKLDKKLAYAGLSFKIGGGVPDRGKGSLDRIRKPDRFK